MAVTLSAFRPCHHEDVARVCHEAFATLHDRHGVARDVPDIATARNILAHVGTRPDYTGIVALEDGRVVGSCFHLHADPIAGVGPVTVAPSAQGRGVGKALVRWALSESARLGCAGTRLFQEAINPASLALYTAAGFTCRDSVALVRITPAAVPDPAIRPLRVDDLGDVDLLSRRFYGTSRAADAARLLDLGFPACVRKRNGRIAGYLFASLFGHAAAETDDDLLALAADAARDLPSNLSVALCPLSRHELLARALGLGWRFSKVLCWMTHGAFLPPPGPHFPSIQG